MAVTTSSIVEHFYIVEDVALDGDTPGERTTKTRPKVADLDSYRWQSHCRGLYQLPVAA